MNRIVIIILLVFSHIFNAASAQSIEDLDNRFGFKTIKLGAELTAFKDGMLTPVSRGDKTGLTKYLYIPVSKDLLNVFDVKFDALYLLFDKGNKLVGIELAKNFSEAGHFITAGEEMKGLVTKFRNLFGPNNSSIDQQSKLGCNWAGSLVLLQVFTDRLGLTKGSENKVCVYDIKFIKDRNEAGF